MITRERASQLKLANRRTVWHGETFAQAVVRLDREITDAAVSGTDGISACYAPEHIDALIGILKVQGFAEAKRNCRDAFRLDVSW